MLTTNFITAGNPNAVHLANAGVLCLDVHSLTVFRQITRPSGSKWMEVGKDILLYGSAVEWANITGTPTTLAGYGITVVPWSLITGTPTTLSGYGITDALSTALASGKLFVGNAGGIAIAETLSGDATLAAGGILAFVNSGVLAGTYGSASKVSVITIDAKGRITSAASTAIAITESQVTNLVADLYALAAAIALKQDASLSPTRIWVGDLGSVPQPVTISGHGSLDENGVLTVVNINDNIVTTAKVQDDAILYSKMQNVSATARILGRKTAAAGDPEECTLSEILDFIGSAAQGDILYRGAASWERLAAGTSGYLLQTNGAAANPSWVAPAVANPWSIVSAASDQAVINNSTLQNDDTLVFAMAANTKYRIRAKIFWDTTAAGDFKYGFAQPTPTGATIMRVELIVGPAGSTPSFNSISTAITTSASLTGTGSTGGYLFLDCIYHNGANAGDFQFMFSQNTAQSDTGAIRRAGSYMEYSIA